MVEREVHEAGERNRTSRGYLSLDLRQKLWMPGAQSDTTRIVIDGDFARERKE
jgi:hypothetical protein